MTILAGNIPYSSIGPKVKYSEIENRIYQRIIGKLYQHPLFCKIISYDWYPEFTISGKPSKGNGKETFNELEELDEAKKYNIRVEIPIELDEKYLIDIELVVVGTISYISNDWVMEAISWEHNINSRQHDPKCEELLFHSRDFSKNILPGHSGKSPWHHQWHVTTKKKLDNEKECHFVWQPYYYTKPQNGIYKKKRWKYKTRPYTDIDEFVIHNFFDICDSYATSGIVNDKSYYEKF